MTLVLDAGSFVFHALVTGTKILAGLVVVAMILTSGLLGFRRQEQA